MADPSGDTAIGYARSRTVSLWPGGKSMSVRVIGAGGRWRGHRAEPKNCAQCECQQRGGDPAERCKLATSRGRLAMRQPLPIVLSRRSGAAHRRYHAGGVSDLLSGSDAGACESRPEGHVGSCVQSGSRSRTFTSVSVTVGPTNAARPCEHFVQHAAERPDIGALVDCLSARLFGTHVGGGSQDDARARRRFENRWRLRRVCRIAGGSWFSQSEVEHLDDTLRRHHHVGGLQIAMDDSSFVCGVQRFDDAAGDGQSVFDSQWPSTDSRGQRLTSRRAPSRGRDHRASVPARVRSRCWDDSARRARVLLAQSARAVHRLSRIPTEGP